MMRRTLILLVAAVMALSPVAALSMSHCPWMMSAACQGPCATYACAASPVPPIQAPAYIEDTITRSVDRAPDATFGTLDPPPKPLSLTS